MEAKDLMIGDLVMWKRYYSNRKIGGMNDKMVRFRDCAFWEVQDWIEPIPLTAEILNANFPDVRYGVFWVWNDYKSTEQEIWFEIRIEIDTDESLIRNIRYVHELQHILRLCGIENEIKL